MFPYLGLYILITKVSTYFLNHTKNLLVNIFVFLTPEIFQWHTATWCEAFSYNVSSRIFLWSFFTLPLDFDFLRVHQTRELFRVSPLKQIIAFR